MTKNTFISSVAGLALALTAVACGETARNDNSPANKNVAIVTNTNTTAAANNNRSGDIKREDFDRDKDKYAKDAKDAGRKIGTGANDLWIWVKTRAALLAADDLRDSTVNVDVDNDNVTLTGTVANAAQKAKAETVAKGIEGVKSVKNQITLKAETKVGEEDDKSTNTSKATKK